MSALQPLRPYQIRAVDQISAAWQAGHKSVCCTCPTGGGKTVIAEELIRRSTGSVLFIVHRRELVAQTLRRFSEHFDTACVCPGYEYRPGARVQIATIQSLLARGGRPDVTLLVLDECHHFRAEDWQELVDHYATLGTVRTVGFTATPERSDGKPLGDIFQHLIVAANYPDLIAAGHLVDCRVFAPDASTFACDGLAQSPLAAWRRYAETSRTFLFSPSVKDAERFAGEFNAEEIAARVVEANTPSGVRNAHLELFRRDHVKVLSNVNVLTEGIDIPAARTCILARKFDHVSSYLQAVGRVLRPDADKPDAILIDLTGATFKHGMPTEKRIYSLTGKAIRRTSEEPIRQCSSCGAAFPVSEWTDNDGACPGCGFVPERKRPEMRIYDYALSLVYNGADTPDEAKIREWARVQSVSDARGFGLGWAVEQYKKLFDSVPQLTPEQRRACYDGWRFWAIQNGRKPGMAYYRYLQLFGEKPPWSWSQER